MIHELIRCVDLHLNFFFLFSFSMDFKSFHSFETYLVSSSEFQNLVKEDNFIRNRRIRITKPAPVIPFYSTEGSLDNPGGS
jgi:hypothetical protein